MGGVATDEAWRGQGIGSTMVAACCECFDRAGGRLLLLGTTNPFAERIYARLGFRRLAGHTFYRATAGARIDEGFAPGHAVRARSASWRDMAVIAPLYLLPHPAVVMDTGTGLASSSSEEPWRCVRIFWDLLASAANGGRWEVLENDAGWIVASALARPCLGVSPPVFSLDFVWHPAYSTEGRRFVADVAARQEAETGRPVEMFVVHGDRWKRGEVERLGFHFAGRIGTTIALGGQPAPLERFKRVQSVKG
jgi:hypothetical protein